LALGLGVTPWVRWTLRAIFGGALFFVVTSVLAWYLAQRTDAYATAISFVESSGAVRETIGPVERIELEPFGYQLHYSGASGQAAFELTVVGSSVSGAVYIELEYKGIWEVTRARLIRQGQLVKELVPP
jgi:hypothetical protein